jgi:hypothetical protein
VKKKTATQTLGGEYKPPSAPPTHFHLPVGHYSIYP